MFFKKKILPGIIIIILVLLIAVFLFIRHLITHSFPEYNTTIQTTMVENRVEIFRDEFGVPFITAATESDAYFGIGIVHAQDRLWQMEMARRAGQGRLSEIFGSETVRIDKLFRILGIEKAAHLSEELLEEKHRQLLERYAAGINFIIERQRGKYPIEFDILDIEPEPWTVFHTMLIGKLMAWDLNISWWVDVSLGHLTEAVEMDLAFEAIPGYPEDAPVIVPSRLLDSRYAESLRMLRNADLEYRTLMGMEGSQVGSNSWVISGNLSESGKPLLANDPHLGLPVPGRWYEIGVKTDDGLNVGGMTLAGVPTVLIGRNNAISWGLTSMMADDTDFYFEEIDTAENLKYRLDDNWIELEYREEIISVADAPDLSIEIYETHRGPLVQSFLGIIPGKWTDTPLSIRWTALDGTEEFKTFYNINRASNYSEFRDALRHFTAPGQNFVYADTAGNIAYKAAGKIPIRPRGNPIIPFPGWDSSYDWNGFIPFEMLPEILNPEEGIIATANNKITDDHYPYYISSLWEPPARIQRILELLKETEIFSVDLFKLIQNDYTSVHARELTPYIESAFENYQAEDELLETTLTYLKNWDYHMGKRDVPAAIFNIFLIKMIENTFLPKMGSELFREYITVSNIPIRSLSELMENPASEWFNNPATGEREGRDDVIRKSVKETLEFLREELGSDMRRWQWGTLHTVTFRHTFGDQPPINRIVNIGPYSIGGSGTTVNNAAYNLYNPYNVTIGPSMRMIIDMSNPTSAFTVVPPGQSGQPLHQHYKDQTNLWLEGKYKTHLLDIDDSVTYKILRLAPY